MQEFLFFRSPPFFNLQLVFVTCTLHAPSLTCGISLNPAPAPVKFIASLLSLSLLPLLDFASCIFTPLASPRTLTFPFSRPHRLICIPRPRKARTCREFFLRESPFPGAILSLRFALFFSTLASLPLFPSPSLSFVRLFLLHSPLCGGSLACAWVEDFFVVFSPTSRKREERREGRARGKKEKKRRLANGAKRVRLALANLQCERTHEEKREMVREKEGDERKQVSELM